MERHPIFDSCVVDLHDVWVSQAGEHPALPAESSNCLRVVLQAVRQEFQGDVSSERILDCVIDNPDAAATDLV